MDETYLKDQICEWILGIIAFNQHPVYKDHNTIYEIVEKALKNDEGKIQSTYNNGDMDLEFEIRLTKKNQPVNIDTAMVLNDEYLTGGGK